MAEAILTILSVRGIIVPPELAERVRACSELSRLESWYRLAPTVDSLDELLALNENASSGSGSGRG